LLFGTLLHVLFGCSLLLGLVDIGVPSAAVGGVREAIDLNFTGLRLVFQERLGEVPTGELQLLADHPGDGDLFLVGPVLPVELLQHVLHLLVGLYVGYAHLPQLAQAALHALVKADLLSGQLVLAHARLVPRKSVQLRVLGGGVGVFEGATQTVLGLALEGQLQLVEIDAPVFAQLLQDEGLLVGRLELRVRPRPRAKDLLVRLDLPRGVQTVNPADHPTLSLSNQQELPAGRPFLDDRHVAQVAFHQEHARALGDAYQFSCIFGLPKKLFPVLAKSVSDALAPKIAKLLKAQGLRGLPHIPLLLHLFEGLVVEGRGIDSLQKLEVVDLDDHPLAHAHVGHEKWVLFDVLDHYELPLHQRKILLSTEFIVAFPHLRIDDQVVGPGLSHLVRDQLHPHPPRRQVLMEIEIEPVQLTEALLLEGELHEVELSRHLAVLQGLAIHVFYLGLNHALDGQMLLLTTTSLGCLAVHR